MSNKGVLFLGFLTFVGIVVYAATRKPKEPSPSPRVEWTLIERPQPTEATSQSAMTTYENIEEVSFPNGFDPETFMPRTIRIKRTSKELR